MIGRVRLSTVHMLAVAFALAATPVVRAGCGDYLVLDHAPLASDGHGGGIKPTQAPCNGPNCQRHDAPPLSSAPTLEIAPLTLKVTVVSGEIAEIAGFAAALWGDCEGRPAAGVELSILRPPRSR